MGPEQSLSGPISPDASGPRPTGARGDPGFRATMAAPFWGAVRPARAGALLAGAGGVSFLLSCVTQALLCATLAVALKAWGDTAPPVVSPVFTATSQASATRPNAMPRSLAEVWRDWWADGTLNEVLAVAGGIMLACVAALMAAGVAFLPDVHRDGSVGRTFLRTVRAGLASGFAGTLLVHSVNACVVAFERSCRFEGIYPNLGPVSPFAYGSAFLIFLAHLTRSARAAAECAPASLQSPRCEGCGYDLSHPTSEARCPECATPLERSLDAGHRPATAFMRSRTFGGWMRDGFAVVFSPGRFYRRLPLRTSEPAARAFARRTFCSLAFGAAVWICAMAAVDAPALPIWWQAVLIPGLLAIVTTVFCWSIHRGVGAIAVWSITLRHPLPDTRWAAIVLAFEAAYLWVICGYLGVLATSFMLFDDWISRSTARSFFQRVFGSMGEPVVALGGLIILGVYWLRRWQIALRAVRWSNF